MVSKIELRMRSICEEIVRAFSCLYTYIHNKYVCVMMIHLCKYIRMYVLLFICVIRVCMCMCLSWSYRCGCIGVCITTPEFAGRAPKDRGRENSFDYTRQDCSDGELHLVKKWWGWTKKFRSIMPLLLKPTTIATERWLYILLSKYNYPTPSCKK